jgi:hypothetical protein
MSISAWVAGAARAGTAATTIKAIMIITARGVNFLFIFLSLFIG